MQTTKVPKPEPNWALLKQYLDEDLKNKQTHWEKSRDDDKLMVYKKKVEATSVIMLRVTTVFRNMDIDIVFNMIVNLYVRKHWDKQGINFAMLEVFNNNEDIVYFEAKAPVVISNRDFIHYRHYFCNKESPEIVDAYNLYRKENKYYMLYVKSVPHPKGPEKKKVQLEVKPYLEAGF